MKRLVLSAIGLATLAPVASAQPGANATAPSHVYRQGDREILTFESEVDYDRLQELGRPGAAVAPVPGWLTTLYYRSALDDSVQPYVVWLPADFSATRTYPLVLQLHGTNFHEVLSHQRLIYRGMGEAQWIPAGAEAIFVHCFGGPTTFFDGMGEEDVLRDLAEVERRFHVDPDRVYLMGHSMGGAGSYTIGLHHPDLFAGITMIDPAMWSRRPPAEDLPAWMEPQLATLSTPNLYPNAFDLRMFFKNAGLGLQRQSMEFSDGINARGGHATTVVIPGAPHAFGDQYSYAHFVPELLQVRRNSHPGEVRFSTNTLRYNRAYWVTIDRLADAGTDSRVTVACAGSTVRVATTNLAALSLRLADSPAAAAISLVVDGGTVYSGRPPAVVHLTHQSGAWQVGRWRSAGLAKRHGLQGPIADAFNSRFLAVYGDGDRPLAIAELDAFRNPAGPEDIQADFPMKPAAAVTKNDIATSNLILFGTRDSNPVIRRLAPGLPAKLLRPGTVFIYPNPESPDRYVVIWSAKVLSLPEDGLGPASWRRMGPALSAKWVPPANRLPDYVRVENGRIVSGGRFDGDWKLAP